MDANLLVRKWGARKLEIAGYENVDPDTVRVEFNANYGGGCETCGNNAYPVVEIYTSGAYPGAWLDLEDVDITQIIREMMELDSDEDSTV